MFDSDKMEPACGARRILLTAGPTREALDPVRYLSNRSSGKMGYAIAAAAAAAGHTVCLISGPTNLPTPAGVRKIAVESAQEMFDAVQREIVGCQVAIFAAAVADYRPKDVSQIKIKKSEAELVIHLEKTPDILGSARSVFGFQGFLVGFAAETNDLEAHATQKLVKKGCDLLLANDVSRSDIGFDTDENQVRLFWASGERESWPKLTKIEVGQRLLTVLEAAHC